MKQVAVFDGLCCPKSYGAVIYLYICDDCNYFGGFIDVTGKWYKKAVNCTFDESDEAKLHDQVFRLATGNTEGGI